MQFWNATFMLILFLTSGDGFVVEAEGLASMRACCMALVLWGGRLATRSPPHVLLFPMSIVGVEADAEKLSKLLSEVAGKDLNELIAEGKKKLASLPAAGAVVAAAPAAGGAAAAGGAPAAKKEEKKEESEEEVGRVWAMPEQQDSLLSCKTTAGSVRLGKTHRLSNFGVHHASWSMHGHVCKQVALLPTDCCFANCVCPLGLLLSAGHGLLSVRLNAQLLWRRECCASCLSFVMAHGRLWSCNMASSNHGTR